MHYKFDSHSVLMEAGEMFATTGKNASIFTESLDSSIIAEGMHRRTSPLKLEPRGCKNGLSERCGYIKELARSDP